MSVVVIKIGGAFLSHIAESQWMKDVFALRASGEKVMIIHGGGPSITKALAASGVQSKFIDGQRITGREEMDVVARVLWEEVNPELVNALQENGVSAIGISGQQEETLFCVPFDPRLGQVGKVVRVNALVLLELLNHQVVVLAPIGVGAQGELYNVNADVAAATVACALPESRLIFLTDTRGVLDKGGEVISEIRKDEIRALIDDKTIQGGMVVKAQMIEESLAFCSDVAIIDALQDHAIKNYILHQHSSGTVFTNNPSL